MERPELPAGKDLLVTVPAVGDHGDDHGPRTEPDLAGSYARCRSGTPLQETPGPTPAANRRLPYESEDPDSPGTSRA